jgi:hypothetical protein
MQHDTVKRSDAAITFQDGDKSWLSTEHLKLHNQPSRKFQQRYIEPCSIPSKIRAAVYELNLPNTMNCHNVFRISKLHPCTITNVQPDYIPVIYEDLVQEKDLEIGNEFVCVMYHMQFDKDFVHKIVSSYPLHPAYGGISKPRGTQLNDNDG